MKLDQLRKIIREEVRVAVKEELQDVMNEAVKYASTPNSNLNQMKPVAKGQPKKWSVGKSATLDEMLNATREEMTAQEANNIMGGTGVQKPNFASMMSNQMSRSVQGPQVGIDISQLDFVNKAKSVLDASYKKDKARVGAV